MDSFERFVSSENDKERQKLRREFLSTIKKRIDETSKYILPEEKTFDFSFMYVPSENIYYEIINEPDILNYANARKVFIVGPSSFYAYLKTILIGFEGLKIEEQTKKILEHIKTLEVDFKKVRDIFSVLGFHLSNALSRYNELDKKINELSLKIKYSKE